MYKNICLNPLVLLTCSDQADWLSIKKTSTVTRLKKQTVSLFMWWSSKLPACKRTKSFRKTNFNRPSPSETQLYAFCWGAEHRSKRPLTKRERPRWIATRAANGPFQQTPYEGSDTDAEAIERKYGCKRRGRRTKSKVSYTDTEAAGRGVNSLQFVC